MPPAGSPVADIPFDAHVAQLTVEESQLDVIKTAHWPISHLVVVAVSLPKVALRGHRKVDD